jgi:hypothetical protein
VRRLLRAGFPTAFERLDEARARRLRRDFGRRGRLLSWRREADGSWRARLSCPDLPRTVERAGRTRSEAIDRADRVRSRILALRADLKAPNGRDARPADDE